MTIKSPRLVCGLVGALMCVGFSAQGLVVGEAGDNDRQDDLARLQAACLLDLDQASEVTVSPCLERHAQTGSSAAQFVLGLANLMGNGGNRLRGWDLLRRAAGDQPPAAMPAAVPAARPAPAEGDLAHP